MKIAEFANSLNLDDYEPPQLDLHCLPSIVFEFSILYCSDLTFFENLQTKNLSSRKFTLNTYCKPAKSLLNSREATLTGLSEETVNHEDNFEHN